MSDCIQYGRVSTDKQDMQRQERMFADYCQRMQLQPVLTLLDEDTSGSIPFQQREQGRRLFPEIRQRIATGSVEVVTTEQDRIGRDTLDIIATIRAIWQLGAVPHFTAEGGALPRSPENELRMEIKASVAQYERNKIRQRIQTKLDGKRAHGELCGTLSYGWNVRYRFTDGHELLVTSHALRAREELDPLVAQHGMLVLQLLEPNTAEQEWLLHMHAWRMAGWSYHRIANELNRRKVPTKTGQGNVILYKGKARFSSGRWQCGNIRKLLNSRTTQDWLSGRNTTA
ncbi:MAG TPA: recombinase family protein [Verrucomicrobiota bacterium]|nr:recombinase family protein [Verrucomicrobiota bacterium]